MDTPTSHVGMFSRMAIPAPRHQQSNLVHPLTIKTRIQSDFSTPHHTNTPNEPFTYTINPWLTYPPGFKLGVFCGELALLFYTLQTLIRGVHRYLANPNEYRIISIHWIPQSVKQYLRLLQNIWGMWCVCTYTQHGACGVVRV